ncbi:hypothetical protein E2C01_008631 [Portunus trituberculatus]|uniref:Uncharacterized protein n=1 Tax=Portunus trituberculatus TaxID=210409 RepID=A0A5B7D2W0_PORTR|nr:hypothetical protein [Portunus trituberculatus]
MRSTTAHPSTTHPKSHVTTTRVTPPIPLHPVAATRCWSAAPRSYPPAWPDSCGCESSCLLGIQSSSHLVSAPDNSSLMRYRLSEMSSTIQGVSTAASKASQPDMLRINHEGLLIAQSITATV